MPNPRRDPDEATPSRPSVRLATEAVVASYIHHLSERHGAAENGETPAASPG